jgi:hypothetical protein
MVCVNANRYVVELNQRTLIGALTTRPTNKLTHRRRRGGRAAHPTVVEPVQRSQPSTQLVRVVLRTPTVSPDPPISSEGEWSCSVTAGGGSGTTSWVCAPPSATTPRRGGGYVQLYYLHCVVPSTSLSRHTVLLLPQAFRARGLESRRSKADPRRQQIGS